MNQSQIDEVLIDYDAMEALNRQYAKEIGAAQAVMCRMFPESVDIQSMDPDKLKGSEVRCILIGLRGLMTTLEHSVIDAFEDKQHGEITDEERHFISETFAEHCDTNEAEERSERSEPAEA